MFLAANDERMTDILELSEDDLTTTSPICLLDHTLADVSAGEDYYYNALVLFCSTWSLFQLNRKGRIQLLKHKLLLQ